MKLRHKVKIHIADCGSNKQKVLQSGRVCLPKRLLTWIFGEICEVLALTPVETVQGVEIQEVRDGDE